MTRDLLIELSQKYPKNLAEGILNERISNLLKIGDSSIRQEEVHSINNFLRLILTGYDTGWINANPGFSKWAFLASNLSEIVNAEIDHQGEQATCIFQGEPALILKLDFESNPNRWKLKRIDQKRSIPGLIKQVVEKTENNTTDINFEQLVKDQGLPVLVPHNHWMVSVFESILNEENRLIQAKDPKVLTAFLKLLALFKKTSSEDDSQIKFKINETVILSLSIKDMEIQVQSRNSSLPTHLSLMEILERLGEKYGFVNDSRSVLYDLNSKLTDWDLDQRNNTPKWLIECLSNTLNQVPSGPNSFLWFEEGRSKSWPLLFMKIKDWFTCETEGFPFPSTVTFSDNIQIRFSQDELWNWEVIVTGK